MKPQLVRLADVFVVGPLMVWGGVELSRRNRAAGNALIGMGVLTVLYNGRNYLLRERGDA